MFIKGSLQIDDKSLVYYHKGSGEKTCLFMCGWGSPHPLSDMYEIAEAVSSKCKVIIVDRFGYGNSDVSNEERCISNTIDEYKMVCDALNVTNNLIVVGHSYGTFLALEFSKRYHEICCGVILIDSYPCTTLKGKVVFGKLFSSAYLVILLKKLNVINKLSDKHASKLLFGDRCVDEFVREDALRVSREVLYNNDMLSELANVVRDLSFIQKDVNKLDDIPFVCVCRDKTVNQNMRYKTLIKHTEIINVGKCSHVIHHEMPGVIISSIIKLLEEKCTDK